MNMNIIEEVELINLFDGSAKQNRRKCPYIFNFTIRAADLHSGRRMIPSNLNFYLLGATLLFFTFRSPRRYKLASQLPSV